MIPHILLYLSIICIITVIFILITKYSSLSKGYKTFAIISFIISSLYIFAFYLKLNILINEQGDITTSTLSSGEIQDSIKDTYGIPNEEIGIQDLKNNNCDTSLLKGYKVIPIFENRKEGFDKSDYTKYSNKFDISKGIKEAYFCIIADVKDPLKTKDGDYYLYVFVNWGYMGGLVNVGYSLTNKVYYDYTTSNNPDLNGRMYGLETPKTYLLDLSNLIVADYQKGKYKTIKPINQLNVGGIQRIGGFVSAGQNGIIDKFLLIYTGGDIKLHIE